MFRCYIVEREKKAGGKSGQADSIRCRKQERGNTDVDNEILLKLYSLYQKELYLYLYSFCGDRHLAEDLLHETFLKALLALPDGHTNMRAWLYMVARNLFYNQQKKIFVQKRFIPVLGYHNVCQWWINPCLPPVQGTWAYQ